MDELSSFKERLRTEISQPVIGLLHTMSSSTLSPLKNRIVGCLAGISYGDKNKGPIRMALDLTESLAENNSLNCPNILAKYVKWWANKEPAYNDTGIVGNLVFTAIVKEHFPSGERPLTVSQIQEKLQTVSQLNKYAVEVDQRLAGKSAGINAAHRGNPLAMCSKFQTLEELMNASKQESQLTHISHLGYQVSQLSTVFCRLLILHGPQRQEDNKYWWQMLQEFIQQQQEKQKWDKLILDTLAPVLTDDEAAFEALVKKYKQKEADACIERDGFSPNTFKAALFLLRKHMGKKFLDVVKENDNLAFKKKVVKECMDESFIFAGGANYCPVLLGAYVGSMFGLSCIEQKEIDHYEKVMTAAEKLASGWNETSL